MSQAIGRPVRLMWTRNDDIRHGRNRPASHHKLRATWALGKVLSVASFLVDGVRTDHERAALRAYARGASVLLRNDWAAASRHLTQALDFDSTFALANYRLATSYGWAESILSDLGAGGEGRGGWNEGQEIRRTGGARSPDPGSRPPRRPASPGRAGRRRG